MNSSITYINTMAPRFVPPTMENIYSSGISTMAQNKSLQQENDELRKQLLDAQELLVKRNIQLATLEGHLQSLAQDEDVVERLSQHESLYSSSSSASGDADAHGAPRRSQDSNDAPPQGVTPLLSQVSCITSDTCQTPALGLLEEERRRESQKSNARHDDGQHDNGANRSRLLNDSTHSHEEEAKSVLPASSDSTTTCTLTVDTDLTSTKSAKKNIAIVSPTSNTSSPSRAFHDDESEKKERLQPSFITSSQVYPSESSSKKSKIQPSRSKLPREAELERNIAKNAEISKPSSMASTDVYTIHDDILFSPDDSNQDNNDVIQVTNHTLVDGDNDTGKYTGQLSRQSKMPHGTGRMEYDAIRSYSGEWNHGRWNGQGSMICKVYEYTGMFHEDRKHGYGKLRNRVSGDVYQGEFQKDEKHGKGTWSFGDGQVYHGYFAHNKFEGQGQFEYKDGSMYFGQWKASKRDGHGIWISGEGKTIHKGLFLQDEPVRGYNERVLYKSTIAEI
jgi:hypothetical protein